MVLQVRQICVQPDLKRLFRLANRRRGDRSRNRDGQRKALYVEADGDGRDPQQIIGTVGRSSAQRQHQKQPNGSKHSGRHC